MVWVRLHPALPRILSLHGSTTDGLPRLHCDHLSPDTCLHLLVTWSTENNTGVVIRTSWCEEQAYQSYSSFDRPARGGETGSQTVE